MNKEEGMSASEARRIRGWRELRESGNRAAENSRNIPDLTAKRPHPTWRELQEKQISRRKLLRNVGLGVAGAIVGTAAVKAEILQKAIESTRKKAQEEFEKITTRPVTSEQKVAKLLLERDRPGDFLRNLGVIGQEDEDGNTIPWISLHSSPQIFVGNNNEPNNVVGRLEAGDIVDKAIIVRGNNWRYPLNRDLESYWIAFYKDKSNDSEVVFVPLDFFGGIDIDNLKKIKPFEVREN